MAFEVKKGSAGEAAFREDFSTEDFRAGGYHSGAFHHALPGGEIRGRQWVFDGIRMLHSESTFQAHADLAWRGDTEMVTMHFNLAGKLSLTDAETGRTFAFAGNQHNIFYGRKAEGRMKTEALTTRLFLVQFAKDAFFKLADSGNDAIRRFAEAVANDRAAAFSDANLPIGLPLRQCIQAVLHCPYGDGLKRMYLLSKAIEMLVLQAESFDKTLRQKPAVLKTDYDQERIVFARDYLLAHLDCPPSLTELTKAAGLNAYKLKRGFKETFGVPAFQYLADVRLGRVREDMLAGRKSATEIAFALGYSSLPHFSHAFKKKFGVSPSRLRG
ncbi:MAG: helix-turn-helix transcriptional regulator [Cytophagales bacterium]|nr:helix-turn-helix transcriptional regulator [Cytophagales bacterium]